MVQIGNITDYIFEGIAIIISIIALGVTIYDRKKAQKAIKLSERAIKLSEGNIELSIRSSISEGRKRMNEAMKDVLYFKLDYPKEDTKIIEKLFYSALEDLINQYERACMLYLDDKIDKERFKIEYSKEIRNLVENGNYKEKYFPSHTSSYKAVLNVYGSWEDTEKKLPYSIP
ncbi:hypothetical protein [Dokdonia sp.]|uniref:hypothetical protein n=1 Tax=Dokdonia sp. TaxID=2024995 RepID=UPI00326681FC